MWCETKTIEIKFVTSLLTMQLVLNIKFNSNNTVRGYNPGSTKHSSGLKRHYVYK